MSEIVDSGDTNNNSMFSQTRNLFTHFFNTTNFHHLTPGGDRMNNIIFNSQKQQDDTQAARMTIFYGDQVIVLDNFPADKALEIMNMLSGTQTASSFVASDLPIARKASLARFLEKRKERLWVLIPCSTVYRKGDRVRGASNGGGGVWRDISKVEEELEWFTGCNFVCDRSLGMRRQGLRKEGRVGDKGRCVNNEWCWE
nr:hypothetical protein [Tanacetum cinerariifolium]